MQYSAFDSKWICFTHICVGGCSGGSSAAVHSLEGLWCDPSLIRVYWNVPGEETELQIAPDVWSSVSQM